ncbi:flagellar hook-associated protein FlgL [Marinobacter sediminum]|uniref:flagellar hook-associated protein FlgL n=1 Tax=Marinobacter sediminum TaxID=256323 RepID=UPI0019394CDC|nr:flagellar hook-associated protein FlgL [Marinobacter sediminum]
MIRISSQQIFSGGINRLQDLNSNLNSTQQQISTGKRVNQPSDDPVAAARILKLDQELSRVETYQRNVNLADNRLIQEESALESSIDIIQRVRELTVQAGNGSLSANDRQSIASELKERLGQLANVANTRDASGEYIFSGFQGSQPAFVQGSDGSWGYNGDEGQRVLEIDDGVTVPISDHGKGIFADVTSADASFRTKVLNNESGTAAISFVSVNDQDDLNNFSPKVLTVRIEDNGIGGLQVRASDGTTSTVLQNPYTAGSPQTFVEEGMEFEITGDVDDEFVLNTSNKQSVFKTIENLISGLETIDKSAVGGQADYDDLIADSLSNLDSAQESIILKQTELGGRMNAVESTKNFLEDSSVYTNQIRSELQDVDYAEAISNLSFQSFVLQAAQQSFAQVSQLSLFDRL